MKIIKSSVEILDDLNEDEILKKLEAIGRICYKSEDKITSSSAKRFISYIIARGHESVIEHFSFSVKFVVDRGVSHEIVRHRLASYSQESTRYCDYSKDGFGHEITVISPFFWEPPHYTFSTTERCYEEWKKSCENSERKYFELLKMGEASPQEARSVLPNSLKTEIIMTANLREWRHFLKLRTAKAAHPQMKEVANLLLVKVNELLPTIFNDIRRDEMI